MKIGFKNALLNFYWTSEKVPAYKDFLRVNKVKPELIKTPADFEQVPFIDKSNYLRKYPFHTLFPKGIIPPFISASSGSSGKPFYWPRGIDLDIQGGHIHENIFNKIFKIKRKRTLVIICFSMGTWVAGTYTLSSCRWISIKNNKVVTVTPGIEKEDIMSVLKNLAPLFDKIILTGYPPFIMDVITEALDQGIKLNKYDFNILFAGENFSEKWRDKVFDLANIKDSLFGSVNIYGTADAAILGHETPATIYIRRRANEDEEFHRLIFDDLDFLPTLVQYYPNQKYFESINGDIIFTTRAGMPLIRYNIHDSGKIFSLSEMKNILINHDKYYIQFNRLIEHWKLPFIFLLGRKDIAVTFYAVNIYPENIKAGLEDDEVWKYTSGKFVAVVNLINDQRIQKLIINVELNRRINPDRELNKLIKKKIIENLLSFNAEYRKLYASIKAKAIPEIRLLKFGDPLFKVKRSKHKWIRN